MHAGANKSYPIHPDIVPMSQDATYVVTFNPLDKEIHDTGSTVKENIKSQDPGK